MIDEESLRGCATPKDEIVSLRKHPFLLALREKSEEKRMFSQATKSLFIHLFIY